MEVGEGRLPQDTRVPDPVFRPLTSQETSPDLNQPIYYSNCTVPVVWYASYLHNFAEVFEGFFLPIWAARKKKAWDTRYSFFFSTRRITPHLSLLSKVHSQFEATTLSAASARIGSSLHSNSTAERVHVRCFETLVMCKVPSEWHWMGRPDLNTGYWDLNIGFERPNWDAAHDFLNATRKMRRLPSIDLSSLPNSINTTSRDHVRATAARGFGRRLRVVIARRPLSPRRSILNIDAVMDWCNSWRPTNQSSIVVGAECVWYAFDDLALGAALMDQTDVFISVHGAASTNAVFMPLGSSAIEIRPLDFQGTWPNHYLRKMLTITDHNSSVFWYGLNVKNPLNSAKGKEEQLGAPDRTWTWMRDRHVRIDTSMLGKLFDEIVHVNGDEKRYQAIASQGRHYIDDLGKPATDWVDQQFSGHLRRRRGEDKNATRCPNEYNIQTIKCPR